MNKVIGLRTFTTLAIGVLQSAPAQAVCSRSVSTSSYVVLYRDTTSPYDYKISKCSQGDTSGWVQLGANCTQNGSGQLTEDVEITGSTSSDLIEILSGASASLSCYGQSLSTHSWPASGGTHTITVDAGAGSDIVTARVSESAETITNAFIFLGGSGDDCISTGSGSGAQQNDYDILVGGAGADVVADDYGIHDKLIGDACSDVYPYVCGPGSGNDCIWAPQSYDLMICGGGTDESYPDYGANGCESLASSCLCPYSWTPPW